MENLLLSLLTDEKMTPQQDTLSITDLWGDIELSLIHISLLNLCKTHKYTLIFFTMHVEFLQLSYAYIELNRGKISNKERIFYK